MSDHNYMEAAVAANGSSAIDPLLMLSNLDGIGASVELQCLVQEHMDSTTYGNASDHCLTQFDSILCWPRTARGTLAVLQCMDELQGIHYDSSKNATRFCHANGTWEKYTNYDACAHLPASHSVTEFEVIVELPTIIYYIGYALSLVSLSLALIVFAYFKELRCLRNTIHANLFFTYIMSALFWILLLSVQISIRSGQASCIALVTLFHFFTLTNFFWMLVEGLYLYMLVVNTFSGDNIRFNIYASIGWGGPALFVITWLVAKSLTVSYNSSEKYDINCPWMEETNVDWIFQGPVCAVLLINLTFLLRIMWVLITKLRSANTVETRQYRKAAKALLVLIPLFGITYLVVLAGPSEVGLMGHMFAVLRAVLLSTQGFSVSLFYCFLNSEVRNALRHHISTWRDTRDIQQSQNRRYTTKSFSKGGSSPRAESMRPLTSYYGRGKRESCVSSATTTTLVGQHPPCLALHRGSNNALHTGGGNTTCSGSTLSVMPRAISPLMKLQQGLEENSV
ncbi:diuretic hormone receptor isoform X1 [Drosophila miranda]|uniref:diuretic hormone receptor isoform X1 n=1 Tax=Drosophila miranda TaxID=7229 RepID=UPI0007E7B30D|nr:diuretic hormone receptor isoform X1 [Drosophila miranda]XP_033248173.1 diuretic hormone receptor isoform X1 [Drosophila miranda]XP_033248174.1 diuretic hormone receptor isoform X1 [Drosophila miranda]